MISSPFEEPQVLALTPRWVVVSKPSGWLTIPGRKGPELDVPVLSLWAEKHYSPIWVVHRLDRETSGVVLFARSAKDHQEANLWFQNRKVKKAYLCLAQGSPSLPLFKVSTPIRGAYSVTQIEVKESFSEAFFAKVVPLTGRTHQIRIHLSNTGHPLWGDSQYGGASVVTLPHSPNLAEVSFEVPRVALHSASLQLPTGEAFEAALPQDFMGWLEKLRKGIQRV